MTALSIAATCAVLLCLLSPIDAAVAPVARAGDKPDSPIRVTASFVTPPALGVQSDLEIRVLSRVDAPATVISVDVTPTPADFLAGLNRVVMTADLVAGVEVVRRVPILPRREATFVVEAAALRSQPGYRFGATATLEVEVGRFGSVTRKPIPPAGRSTVSSTRDYSAAPVARLPEQRKGNATADAGVAGAGEIDVTGVWRFTDRNGVAKPLRDARVEIWDQDTFGDDLLATVHTDNSGSFSTPLISNIDTEGGGQEIYVKVFARDDHAVRVTVQTSDTTYTAQTANLTNVPDGTVNVGTNTITDATNRMAFYIYDLIANDAFDFLYNQVGWDNSFNLRVRWQSNSNDGTYYTLGGNIALVAGDRWDPDVILHEYGHYVMFKIYGNAFPSAPNCGSHYWDGAFSNGCAWTEGWANFLQAAIQNDRFYDDTEDQTLHIDYEPPNPGALGPSVEGAVTASLWDVFDSGSELWDTLSDGINGTAGNGIWKVLQFGLQPDAVAFYDDWTEVGNPSGGHLNTIFSHHQVVPQSGSRTILLSGNLGYGSVVVGTTSTRTLVIMNTGTSTMTISSISYPSGFSGAFSGTIAAGGTANVPVTFAPTVVGGYGGTVTVNADNTGGLNTTIAAGTGIAPTITRIIGLSGNMAFGNVTVGTTATRTLTISNSGNSTMTVTGILYPNGFSGAFTGAIAAGGSANVTVTFAPTVVTSQSGYGGYIQVQADWTSGLNIINSSGTGTAPDTVSPVVAITSPTSAATWPTSAPSISIGGTASDAGGVTDVYCVNTTTGQTVTAVGTTNWTCLVALVTGTNSIGVGARDAANNLGTDSLTVTYTPPAAGVFSNTAPIEIPLNSSTQTAGNASPYPSTITVSGLTGTIQDVTVSLSGFSHTFPQDVGMVLVGPTGQAFAFMDRVGGSADAVSINLTFSDTASAAPPATLTSGTYKPQSFSRNAPYTPTTFPSPGPGTTWASPAPSGSATFAGTFGGTDPNGAWKLYVLDAATADIGAIAGGWSIAFVTTSSGGLQSQKAELTTPASGSTLTASTVAFEWTGGDRGDAILALRGQHARRV